MAEDSSPMTLQQRIAALNASHLGRAPGDPPPSRPKPPVTVNRPRVVARQKTVNNPPSQAKPSAADTSIGNLADGPDTHVHPPPPIVRTRVGNGTSKPPPPPLPKRQSSQPCPALPLRRPSEQKFLQDASEATSPLSSGVSSTSPTLSKKISRVISNGTITAPAGADGELPPLPPRRNGSHSVEPDGMQKKPEYHRQTPSVPLQAPSDQENLTPGGSETPLSLPPRLPARRQTDRTSDSPPQTDQRRRVLPAPGSGALDELKRPARSFVAGKHENPAVPAEKLNNNAICVQQVETTSQPPAVPLASRPKLFVTQSTPSESALAMKSDPSVASTGPSACMICRDFSAPDQHATLFPRQRVQSLQDLGRQLTSPFSSATDKARAIFTWLHHNIRYDTEAYFSRNVQPSTPQSTFQTGLAVCEGFAGLFTALATYAGLESVSISGHGKGYGFTPLSPGAPVPPYSSNHAWNAVRIDGGEWKLIDCCWGAGHVQGQGKPYVQRFEPRHFIMTNEEFGVKHFPTNRDMFFLPGGRRVAWEEYILLNPQYWPNTGEPPTVFSGARPEYGVGERTVCPRNRFLSPSAGGTIHFSFALQCPHWDLQTHTQKGPPPVFMLATHGIDGREKKFVPLEHVAGSSSSSNNVSGTAGDSWHVQVDAKQLGTAGQTLTLFAVTSFGTRTDARGLTVHEFRQGQGKVGMGFSGVAAWELV